MQICSTRASRPFDSMYLYSRDGHSAIGRKPAGNGYASGVTPGLATGGTPIGPHS